MFEHNINNDPDSLESKDSNSLPIVSEEVYKDMEKTSAGGVALSRSKDIGYVQPTIPQDLSIFQQQSPSSNVVSNMPAIADDVDLIEKEWVEKAKHIVAITIGDPYQQNKQLSKVKADYIKKRYNKIIKLGE